MDQDNEYQDDFEPETTTPVQKPLKKGKPGPPPEQHQSKPVDKKQSSGEDGDIDYSS